MDVILSPPQARRRISFYTIFVLADAPVCQSFGCHTRAYDGTQHNTNESLPPYRRYAVGGYFTILCICGG